MLFGTWDKLHELLADSQAGENPLFGQFFPQSLK
jgi:hypothetical protein